MDELVRMLLEGKSDQQILSRIHELESSMATENIPASDSPLDVPEDLTVTDDTSGYVSMVRVDGRPILPPVLSQEAKSLCKSWKEEAMEKESLISLKSERIDPISEDHDVSDAENNYQSEISDSDMEPRSFSEIRKRMLSKKMSCLSTPRSGVPSLSGDSVVTSSELSLSDNTTMPLPSTARSTSEYMRSKRRSDGASYKAEFYSDGEEEIPAFRYDSTLSVNTVIERSLTPTKLSDSPSSNQDNLTGTEKKNLAGGEDRDRVAFADHDHDQGQDQEQSPREHPLRRHGSYSLDKPSPLLQAHLLKFGDEEDISLHDMSLSQRVDSPVKNCSIAMKPRTEKQDMLVDINEDNGSSAVQVLNEERNPDYKRLDNILLSELEQFSISSTPRPPLTVSAQVGLECQLDQENQNNNLLSPNSVISSSSEKESSCHEITETISQSQQLTSNLSLLKDLQFNNKRHDPYPIESNEVNQVGGHSPTKNSLAPAALEVKVQELADKYVQDLKELLHRQEQERIKLRQDFEHQQRALVDQILGQFPQLQSLDKENISPEEDNTISLISNSQSVQNVKQNLFSEEPEGQSKVSLPEAAYLPRYSSAWTRLTALARGFLVRRLISTEKVQALKRTIKDTVSCAVKLHLDTGGQPSSEDLELHSRLLVQLESACLSIHNIFFNMSTHQRMSIISLDRGARKRKSDKPLTMSQEKRVSSATKNRIERQKVSAVSKGRQVLSRLQQNSPYKGNLTSRNDAATRKNEVKPATKFVTNVSSTDKQKRSVQSKKKETKRSQVQVEPKKVATIKQSPKKPAWK